MKLSVSHQLFVFVCMFFCGCATGIVFDVFRAVRRCIKSGSRVIAAQDLLLWFLELIIVYCTAFKVNNAQIRGYEAVALMFGAFMYFIILSEKTVNLVSKIILFLLKTLSLIAKPAKKLAIFLKKPLKKCFLFLKTRHTFVINSAKNVKQRITLALKTAISGKKHKI